MTVGARRTWRLRGACPAATLVLAVCLWVCVVTPGAAQQGDSAGATRDEALVQQFQQMLKERDAIIIELLHRLDALEGRLLELEGRETTGAAPPDLAPDDGPPKPKPEQAEAQPEPAEEIEEQKAPPAVEAEIVERPAAPGEFEVDETAAERALERTLVQGGSLLLPAGQAEITPGFRFTRSQFDTPTVFTSAGETTVAKDEIRRNRFDWDLGLQFGLPYDSQLELEIPYRLVDQSRVVSVGFNEQRQISDTGSGIGDLRLGVAKTLLREARWWPDVVARLTWDTATGEQRDGGVALGGAFHELTGELSYTMRQDPLVFVGTTAYRYSFENDNIKRGNALRFSMGTLLAASPETSLRFTFDQTFIDEFELDGRQVDGSDLVSATLNLGASMIVGPRLLLDLVAGVGVTDDSPDYTVKVSLPFRFDTPLR